MYAKGTLFGKPRNEVIKHPGSFSNQAHRAGMSTRQFASKELKKGSHATTKTKRKASLAQTLMGFHH